MREDENDVSDDEGEEGFIIFFVVRKIGFLVLDRRWEVEVVFVN